MLKKHLVSEGKTDFVLVIPSSPGAKDKFIAEEFQTLLREASGAKIKIVTDAEEGEWTEKSKIISFGFTKQLVAANIFKPEKKLGFSGFLIKTKGDSIFVCGESEKTFGTMYGGYELLSRLIDFEQYGIDCTHYKNSEDITFDSIDLTDVPDFEYRKDPIDFVDEKHRNRLRFIAWNELMISVPGYGEGHNSFGYVEPKIYKEKHPEWFISSGQQLSLSAHGDEKSAKELAEVAFESLVKFVNDNPEKNYIAFAMQDADTMDRQEMDYAIEKYGALSGLWVEFLNGLAVRLRAYFAEKGVDRSVKIVFYAYVKLQSPPVKKDEQGNYYPTIKADKDVIPFFCPIFMHEGVGIGEKRNFADKVRLDNWKLVADEVWVWFYNACYHDMLFPRYAFDAIAPSIRYAKDKGVALYFSQGQTGNHNPWNFGELQTYLESKLSWNSKLNEAILIDEWFSAYFEAAASEMKSVYVIMRDNYRKCTEEYDLRLLCDMAEYKVFRCNSREYIKSVLNHINLAYKAIQQYKDTDVDLFGKLYKRITVIKISFLYLDVWLYKNDYEDFELYAKEKEIYRLCQEVKATHFTESLDPKGNIERLWTYWGVI